MAGTGDQDWIWLSLGAAACVVSGVLFGTVSDNRRAVKKRRTSSISLADIKVDSEEEYKTEDAAAIIVRLREADWHTEIIQSLDDLDFVSITDTQLNAIVCEKRVALEKDILSFKTLCERFRSKKAVLRLFIELLKVYQAALPLLNTFAEKILQAEEIHEVSAEAQSYSHCLSFSATHSSCAEIVGAIAVNFPVRWMACRKLSEGLAKSRGWSKQQIAFAETLSQPLPNFDELLVEALSEALKQEVSNWQKIEQNGKVLQKTEKLFWNTLIEKRRSPKWSSNMTSADVAKDSGWEGVNITRLPTIKGEFTNFDTPSSRMERKSNLIKKTSLHVRDSLNVTKPARRRTNSVPMYLDRVASMSPEEVDEEIEEMTKHMHRISSRFNALQDNHEEKSHTSNSSSMENKVLASLQDIELEGAPTEEGCSSPGNNTMQYPVILVKMEESVNEASPDLEHVSELEQ